MVLVNALLFNYRWFVVVSVVCVFFFFFFFGKSKQSSVLAAFTPPGCEIRVVCNLNSYIYPGIGRWILDVCDMWTRSGNGSELIDDTDRCCNFVTR